MCCGIPIPVMRTDSTWVDLQPQITGIYMELLSPLQLALIALCFVWSGFVRSGLGFGGAVLTLPFLLLILNAPLVFLPIISVHLLVFSGLTLLQARLRHHRSPSRATTAGDVSEATDTVNWVFLRYAFPIMLLPKVLGVIGVIALPPTLASLMIFVIVGVYSVSYLLNRPIRSRGGWSDTLMLAIGGYVSGTSLIAAPLVVPVAASRMAQYQIRDTLFVLWFVLVGIKLIAFVISGIDLQLRHHLWLLPCAGLGHVLGLRFHRYTLQAGASVFLRYVGAGLLAVTVVGFFSLLRQYL